MHPLGKIPQSTSSSHCNAQYMKDPIVMSFLMDARGQKWAVRSGTSAMCAVGCGSTVDTRMRQKVVVLSELQRAIIYTTR
jgi:hypothetical protein